MRVFYIVVFITAALFASAIARPESKTNRHERRARSAFVNQYQKPQFNPDFDAIQNQWENDRSYQVPPVPEFSKFDWENYQPGSGRSSFNNQGQFIDVDDDGNNNGMEKFLDSVRHVSNNDDGHNQDVEDFINSLRQLNKNDEDEQKNSAQFIEPVHHFNEDQDSQNDIEPIVHKEYYPTLGQWDNDHEVNTNNIDQNFDISGHRDQGQHQNRDQDWDLDQNQNQNWDHHRRRNQDWDQDQDQDRNRDQDWDQYDDDDDSDSTWDDDSGPNDSGDDDFDEDDSRSNDSDSEDDFEDDSLSRDDFNYDDSSKDVDESKDEDDQIESQKPTKKFNDQGSINPKLVNGPPYFGRYKLDNQLGGNNDPRIQRWDKTGTPYKDSYLKNECIVLCNTMKHSGDNLPEINSLCQCYNGGMVTKKK